MWRILRRDYNAWDQKRGARFFGRLAEGKKNEMMDQEHLLLIGGEYWGGEYCSRGRETVFRPRVRPAEIIYGTMLML
jgi:hypothetical protein